MRRWARGNLQSWFAELAAKLVEAGGDDGQTRQAFEHGFSVQRLEFLAQVVADLSEAPLQEIQGRCAQ